MAATVAQTAGIIRVSGGQGLMLNNVQAGSAIAVWGYGFSADVTGTPSDSINTYTRRAHVINSNGSGMSVWTTNSVSSGNYTIESDPSFGWFAAAEIRGCDTSASLVDNVTTVALGAGGSGVIGSDETGNAATSASVALGGAGLAWCIFESAGGTAIQDNTGGLWTLVSPLDAFSGYSYINNTTAAIQTAKWIERNQTTDQFTAIIIVIKIKPPEPPKITRGFAN